MNSKTKRFLSLLLTVVMLIGMLPVAGVSAAGTSVSVTEGVDRIYGDNRYETAFAVADAMKACIGVDKFESVVVAYGREFADALAGSYLAIQKNAPILLISQYNQDQVKEYIRANLVQGGTVYLLGGTTVVPESMASGLDDFQVKRLAGANRLGTNLAILNEVPIGGSDLLVCTGWEYADALSASATGLPIMLLSPRGLTAEQKTFLEGVTGNIIICGGTNAVSADVEAQLAQYGQVQRLAGANRNQTSVMVAERFVSNPSYVVLAYSRDFPDGLCGGVLANKIGAPIILTQNNSIDAAKNYVQGCGIAEGIVLGGSGLVSDESAKAIFTPAPVLEITVDQTAATVTDIHQSISGTFSVENGTLEGIACTATNAEYPDSAFEIGDVMIDESTGTWTLSDILLYPGANVITVTLSTLEGFTKSASVTVTYDSGTFADYEASEITYFEDDSGVGFVNNVVLVVIDEELSPEEQQYALDSVIEMSAGSVIGQLNSANVYQVEVSTSGYEQLEALCENLSGIYGITATCDLVLPDYDEEVLLLEDAEMTGEIAQTLNADGTSTRSSVIPSDPWGTNGTENWNEDAPSGDNWWVEAVKAPSAWSRSDVMNQITIGIADSGIDTDHEDIHVSRSLNQNVPADHGTHVAGIIGAIDNNNVGLTGMVWNHNIINYDAYRGAKTTSEIVEAVNQLIEAGARVINDSNGSNLDPSRVDYWDDWTSATVNNWANTITDDFLIVQSAGNKAVDSRRAGTFASISDSSALEHVIIVAATERPNNGSYVLTDFSNYGNYVTIAAPGRDIFSSIRTRSGEGSYGYMSGTSMAAPIVTGVAAMVWSINPSLSAAQVKQILVDTATTPVSGYYDSNIYYMVDAQAAVEEAVATAYSNGTAEGRYVDAATGVPLELTYRIHQNTSDGAVVYNGTSDSNGNFSFELPAGTYVIEAYGSDMITAYTTFQVWARSHTDMGDIPISTEIDENTYRVVLEWGEYPWDLDSHMVARKQAGGSIHVLYYDMYFDEANLDIDDTSSYGPETITINGMSELNGFTYCVHNYTDRYASSGEEAAYSLSQSGAIVKLYRANTLVETFHVPQNRAGTVWNVFSIDRSGNISVHNSFEFISSPGDVGSSFLSNADNVDDELQLFQRNTITENFEGVSTLNAFNQSANSYAVVPGLREDMVPQGLTYREGHGWTYISAYHCKVDSNYEELSNYNKKASVIMALDGTTQLAAEYHLKKGNGSNYTGHVGGLAIYGDMLFFSNSEENGRYRITMLDLNSVPMFGSCDVNIDALQSFDVPMSPSFLGCRDGILWVGNFYHPSEGYGLSQYINYTTENHNGEEYGCYIAGYDLDAHSTMCLYTESGESYATPDYMLAAEKKIQGLAFDRWNNKVMLSKSYGRGENAESQLIFFNVNVNDSYYADGTITLNGESVPLYILDSQREISRMNLPKMAEGIVNRYGSDVMILFESGANKYGNGAYRTDETWFINY